MSGSYTRERSTIRNGRQRLREITMVQNYTVVWLDANIDESDGNFQHSFTQLRRNAAKIDTFTNVDQCLGYIQSTKDIRVFLIISGALGQSAMPHIDHLSNIESVYVFCSDKAKHEQWASDWTKIAGVFTNIDRLCEKLSQDAKRLDRTTIPISITSSDLSHLEPSFMYTQLIKEILLKIDYDDNAMNELTTTCRHAYKDSAEELCIIDEFQRDYARHSPIWWYTRECFTYRMLNQALRNQDVDILIKMGFFLRDLHRQIEQLHSTDRTSKKRFIVYRGQGLSTSDFEKIKSNRNGLISFNNFLSTSFAKETSKDFALEAPHRSDTVRVVFRMTIDPSISTTSFVSLNNISYYGRHEQELLFSMHTVFRIGDVQPIDGGIWRIKLSLCSDDEDEKLHQLTKAMREQTAGGTPWHQLASVLLKTGDYERAENIYRVMMHGAISVDDEDNVGFLSHQLGVIKAAQGDHAEALKHYRKALDISHRSLPPTHPQLATNYGNIGSVYDSMGEYSKALKYHQKALDILVKSLPSAHPDLASTYSKIGSVYEGMGKYLEALEHHQKALDIYAESLPPTHPSLATTYSKIGSVYESMGEYSKALVYHHKDLDICLKSLPPAHPDLATTYSKIGSVHGSMEEHLEALAYHQKALDIRLKSFPPTPSSLATTYSNIGSAYDSMGEYWKALEYHQKALDIFVKSLPPTHPSVATAYSKIGSVYDGLGDYVKALEYHQKDLDICLKSLSSTHSSLATTYSNIGSVYDSMGKYSEALEHHQKALDIYVKSLSPTHPHIGVSHFNIGCVHEKMGDCRKAGASMEQALKIAKSSLPSTHPYLETFRNALQRVRQNC